MWLLYILLLIILVIAATLWLIAPRKRRDCSPFDCTLFAHRGLYDNNGSCPENSLAAFRAAKEAGYGVELDVRYTADRQVVVFHDDTLTRMCGIERRVDECTYAELQEYRLLNTDEHIPLLRDTLNVLGGVPVLCEIKAMPSYTDTALCQDTLAILATYNGAFCIESFNPFMVRWFRIHAPAVIRGILSKRYIKNELQSGVLRPILTAMLTNCLCRPDFIAYCHTDRRQPFLRLCRRFHPLLIAWTVRSQQNIADAKNTFDTFIFEGFLPHRTSE